MTSRRKRTKERQVCLAQGIKSSVAIPLRVGGSVLGIISFSFLRGHCEWQPEVVSRLQVIGEVFANALVRKRSEEAIRAALAENERLRERLERENVYLREQMTLQHHHGRIDRQEPGAEEGAVRGRAGGGRRHPGSVARRNRHRQGVARADDP